MKHRPKHILEYLFLRGLALTVMILPYRLSLWVGWCFGFLGHRVIGFRKQEARRRIRDVVGNGLSEPEIKRAAWISFRNLCFNAVEILRLPLLNEAWIRSHVEIINEENIKREVDTGKGAIFAVCHMGNWDLAGVGAGVLGYPMFFLARRQKNPLVDDFLNRMRGANGVEIVLNDSATLKNTLKKLKQGMVFAILPDVRAKEEALPIHYLGKEANIGAGMALFARQADVPICPAILRRKGWGRHAWHVGKPVRPDSSVDKREDWVRMTQEIMTLFSDAIRETPEQYFWYNKRWVLQPLDE